MKRFQIIGGDFSPIESESIFDSMAEAQASLEFLQEMNPDCDARIVEINAE